jgi:hypothetical protein
MLSIGGSNLALGFPDSWIKDPDPFVQGLGVFDLTAMNWSPGYNASAAAYESPQVVKDWYGQG